MTDGAPLGATQGLALYAYKQAFAFMDAGYASAVALLQLVVIVALVVVGRLSARRVQKQR